MNLPGTYERCMSGHYYACTRGDEECPICERIRQVRKEINDMWVKHAEDIRTEGIETFQNPMLALVSRVMLEQMGDRD